MCPWFDSWRYHKDKDPICVGSLPLQEFAPATMRIPDGISLRTRCGNSFTFCIAQKVTKMLVALKTRLFIPAFVWFPGLLARLFLFHVLFLSFVVPYRVLSVHETGRMRCSDSLARQSLLIEMISLNDFVAHEMREFVFFFSAKKNQKARAPKNSLIQLRISLAFWYAHASMYFNILFLVFDYYQIES